mgnify:CR=1 FL=1
MSRTIACDAGTSGAPTAPCSARKSTSCSSDSASPHASDAAPNATNYYDKFKLLIRDVWRFEQEDTLVFRIELENSSDSTIYYKPQDLAVRLEDRIYTQSIADASGVMPPKSTTPAFFAVTGNGQGGRNNLAPDNKWNVLVLRAEGRQQPEESK